MLFITVLQPELSSHRYFSSSSARCLPSPLHSLPKYYTIFHHQKPFKMYIRSCAFIAQTPLHLLFVAAGMNLENIMLSDCPQGIRPLAPSYPAPWLTLAIAVPYTKHSLTSDSVFPLLTKLFPRLVYGWFSLTRHDHTLASPLGEVYADTDGRFSWFGWDSGLSVL